MENNEASKINKKYDTDRNMVVFLNHASKKINLKRNLAFYLKKSLTTVNERYFQSYTKEDFYAYSVLTKDSPTNLINVKVGSAKSSAIIASKIIESLNSNESLMENEKDNIINFETPFLLPLNVGEKLLHTYNQSVGDYARGSKIELSNEEVETLINLEVERLKETEFLSDECAFSCLKALKSKNRYNNNTFSLYYENKDFFDDIHVAPLFMKELSLDRQKNHYVSSSYEMSKQLIKDAPVVPDNSVFYKKGDESTSKINSLVYNTIQTIVNGMSIYNEDSNWAFLAKRTLKLIVLDSYGLKVGLENCVKNNSWKKILIELQNKKWDLPEEFNNFLKANLIGEEKQRFFYEEKDVLEKPFNENIVIDNELFIKSIPDVYRRKDKDEVRKYFKEFKTMLELSSNIELDDILIGNQKTYLNLESNEQINIPFVKELLERFMNLVIKNSSSLDDFKKNENKISLMLEEGLKVIRDFENKNNNISYNKVSIKKF